LCNDEPLEKGCIWTGLIAAVVVATYTNVVNVVTCIYPVVEALVDVELGEQSRKYVIPQKKKKKKKK
jgi:hypothetical protein